MEVFTKGKKDAEQLLCVLNSKYAGCMPCGTAKVVFAQALGSARRRDVSCVCACRIPSIVDAGRGTSTQI
jgi:hypothetical protein